MLNKQGEIAQTVPFDWGQDEAYSSPEPTQQFLIKTAVRERRIDEAARVWSDWYASLAVRARAGQEISESERKGFEDSILALPAPRFISEIMHDEKLSDDERANIEPTKPPTNVSLTKEITDFLHSPDAKAHYLSLMLGDFEWLYDEAKWRRCGHDSWQPNEADMIWLIEMGQELRNYPNVLQRIDIALTMNAQMLLRIATAAIIKSRQTTAELPS